MSLLDRNLSNAISWVWDQMKNHSLKEQLSARYKCISNVVKCWLRMHQRRLKSSQDVLLLLQQRAGLHPSHSWTAWQSEETPWGSTSLEIPNPWKCTDIWRVLLTRCITWINVEICMFIWKHPYACIFFLNFIQSLLRRFFEDKLGFQMKLPFSQQMETQSPAFPSAPNQF